MKYVKLKFNNISGYDVEKYDQYGLNILGEFFCTEMRGGGFDFFYEWMNKPEWNETGGNIMEVKKNHNNAIIYFSDDREEYLKNSEEYAITIPLDQLIKLSEEWLELKKTLPPFIIITEEHNQYTMKSSQE